MPGSLDEKRTDALGAPLVVGSTVLFAPLGWNRMILFGEIRDGHLGLCIRASDGQVWIPPNRFVIRAGTCTFGELTAERCITHRG